MKRSTALVLSALACAYPGLSTLARADALTPIKVGASFDENFAEGYYGKDTGIFEKAGLDAAVTGMAGGGPLTTAVMGGALDVVTTNTGSMSTAFAKGLPIVLIAPGGNYTAKLLSAAIAVRLDSPIKTGADLVGKTVAVTTLKSVLHTSVRNWIDSTGGDSERVGYVELGLPTMLPALQSGRVDATTFTEPWVTQAKGKVKILGSPYESLGHDFMISGWVTNKPWLDANRDTARKFVRSVTQIADWANKNPLGSAQIMSKYFQIPVDTIVAMQRTKMGLKLDPSNVQPVIDVLYKYKLLDRHFAAGDMMVSV
jgi:NitT/TauT family transport system substrate-binding protein